MPQVFFSFFVLDDNGVHMPAGFYLLLTSLGPSIFNVEGAGALGGAAYVLNMFWEILDPSLVGWGPRGFHAFRDG